ncbi:MAG: hypothetical protein Q9187_000614, partial [Circinaria calcarea]
MSMPGWLNDVPAVSNNDHGTFNPSVDPTMSFMHTPTSATFDYNQMQNAQLQQRMQNGNVRNGSPAYLNPSYQTQPIVPSKRPRPRDDMFSASPRQAPGALPSSRSQTPQQGPYPGVHPSINGGQSIQAPPAYQHLQHGVLGNTSPSPIMQDQHYNSQAIPQRMQTASPSPFSPVGQNYGSQASPHSDYGSRVDTPQNGSHSYVQGMPYGSGSHQYFPSSSGPTNAASQGVGQSPYGGTAANLQQPARIYEMRQQQQLARQYQATNSNPPNRQQGSSLNPLAHPSNPMATYQQAARAQQMQQSIPRQANHDQFFRALAQFMQQQGLPLNVYPIIQGRSVPLTQLYVVVMRYGGSKKVTMSNQWPTIAASLHFPPVQYPNAAQEIQSYWHSNIAPFEQVWWQNMHQQRQRALNSQIPNSQQGQGGEAANIHDQFSPIKTLGSNYQEQSAMLHARRQTNADFQTPTKQLMPQQNDMRQPQTNGFSTPQQAHVQNQQHSIYGPSQSMLSLPPQITSPHAQQPTYPTPGSVSSKKESYSGLSHQPASRPDPAASMPRKAPMGPHFFPKFHPLEKVKDGVESHGGIQVSSFKDVVDSLIVQKPNVPTAMELGVVDIRALTMSLRSGIHAEVRLALDTLATLSNYDRQDNRAPVLENCEDLVETLIDCAEEQVEVLAENAAEVSDVMLISPYEEIVRGCRSEVETLQEVPEFGTLDYDLDRSVERLICITTILRNFSFFESNHVQLADPIVVRFMTTVMRYLGTRNMLLRTHRNTLDFTKDIITYLSNLSHTIDLPGREEAACILHFLLSFAPSPPPTTHGIEEVMFTLYSPSVHRYLPPAVDSLAKLLARDDPNRTFYKSIFAADSTSTPPYDLLTRTFALAIAPIPEPAKMNLPIVEARKPYLAQGLLAAEIIVTLIPSSEHMLAWSWLNSQDGFATRLLQLVSLLSLARAPTPPRHQPGSRVPMADPDQLSYGMITNR